MVHRIGEETVRNSGYDPFTALTTVLHQEVAVLEELVFRLTKAELLIKAREARFMGLAVDEVEDVATELGAIELARAMAAADAATSCGLPDSTSLAELVAHAEPALRGVLGDLRARLASLTEEVENLTVRGTSNLGLRIEEARSAANATRASGLHGGDYAELFGGRRTPGRR